MKTVLISLFMVVNVFIANAKEKVSTGDKVAQVLSLNLSPSEVVDSVLEVIYLECDGSLEGFAEGEVIMVEKVIPFIKNHAKQLPLKKQSEVYIMYAKLCGRQGKERMGDAQRLCDSAIGLARKAGDWNRMGRVYELKALFEEMYGDSRRAFEYFGRSIDCFRKSKENAEVDISRSLFNQANILLRLSDYDGIARVMQRYEDILNHLENPVNRDRIYFDLLRIKDVYFGEKLKEASVSQRKALLDSLNQAELGAIALLETSDNEELRCSIDPTWLYYNRAVSFVEYFDHPSIDSVEYYISKMTERKGLNREEIDFEIQVSQQSLRASMWAKLGQYEKARTMLEELLSQIQVTPNSKNLIINRIDIYEDLKKISETSGRYKEAAAYGDSIRQLEHQRYDMQLAESVKDSEAKYKTQETALALSRSEARRATTLAWFIGVAALFLLSSAIFMFYAAKQRRRRMAREVEFAKLRADIGRQLTRQYIEGLENERSRMANELHDGVCNDLLAVQMQLPDDQARMLDACRESVRRISHELMPPEFAYANIDEVIRYFVNKQSGSPRVEYFSSASDWSEVPDATALEIYRIVQEAVGNALKHSGAALITVDMNLSRGLLRVEIRDDGKYNTSGKRGQGLGSMRRRASSINGDLMIENLGTGGTRLVLTVQL